MLWQLIFKDIKVRYVSTKLGFLWAIINPVLTLLILVFVFNNLLKTESDGYNKIVITIIGISVWNFVSGFIAESSNSLITNQALIKKIYFPKIILPISKIGIAGLDFAIAFIITIIVLLVEKVKFSNNIIYLPLILLLLLLISIGVAVLINSLIIQFRDIIHIIPFLLRIGIFISPVAFSANIIDKKYAELFYLNPITGFIELTRWSIIKDYPFPEYCYISLFTGLFLSVIGIIYFIKIEKEIVDRL